MFQSRSREHASLCLKSSCNLPKPSQSQVRIQPVVFAHNDIIQQYRRRLEDDIEVHLAWRDIPFKIWILAAEAKGDSSEYVLVLMNMTRRFGTGIQTQGEMTQMFGDGITALLELLL
jgi:hypothetical protein